jgi:type II secretory pathway component PulM
VELEPRQRNLLMIGALMGAVLGAGTAWLLMQPVEEDPDRPNKPLRAGELFRLTSQVAGVLRQVDDVRRRA